MIHLRRWTEDDAAALNAAVAESREHLLPWLPWASEPPMSDAARRAWIRDRERDALGGGDLVYGVWLDGTIAGSVGLHRRIGPGGLEIGYWTRSGFTRRGIAVAAVARVCEIAFAQPSITRVEIHHDSANVASGAVARAAGFTHVGDQPDPATAPDDSGIERIWRLTHAEWEHRAQGVGPDHPSAG